MHAWKLHPRQAFITGCSSITASGQYSTFSLYNASQSRSYIAILDWQIVANTTGTMYMAYSRGNFGGTALTVLPFIPEQGDYPAQAYNSTQASQVAAGGYALRPAASTPQTWPHNYPFCVLAPGWQFYLQHNGANDGFNIGVLGQWLTPEQLDEGSWLAANANLLLDQPGS